MGKTTNPVEDTPVEDTLVEGTQSQEDESDWTGSVAELLVSEDEEDEYLSTKEILELIRDEERDRNPFKDKIIKMINELIEII